MALAREVGLFPALVAGPVGFFLGVDEAVPDAGIAHQGGFTWAVPEADPTF